MTETAPEQRHEIFPSLVVSTPDDYPSPKAGIVTRLTLSTPDGEPVGVLLYDDKGLFWTPADTEDEAAQEHAAELLNFIRGNRGEGVALADAVQGIRDAYDGDMAEDQVRFIPAR